VAQGAEGAPVADRKPAPAAAGTRQDRANALTRLLSFPSDRRVASAALRQSTRPSGSPYVLVPSVAVQRERSENWKR
jgi:hypothetical protein